MDDQEKCLSKLIECFGKVSISALGGGKVCLDFYRDKNDNVLIRIGCIYKVGFDFYRDKNDNVSIRTGCIDKETDHTYLSDHAVISKGEVFVKLFTGCTGESSIDEMLTSFDELHGESGSNYLSAFLQSLEANKIILCYTRPNGGSRAVLVMLYNICQKLGIACTPIIIKPALFRGPRLYLIDVKYFAGYFDTPNYHIYDEGCLMHRLGDISATLSPEERDTRMKEELLTIANSMMKC
jgi:hypothetical protein